MKKEKVFRYPVTVQLEQADYEKLRTDAFLAHQTLSAFVRDLVRTYVIEKEDLDELMNK